MFVRSVGPSPCVFLWEPCPSTLSSLIATATENVAQPTESDGECPTCHVVWVSRVTWLWKWSIERREKGFFDEVHVLVFWSYLFALVRAVSYIVKYFLQRCYFRRVLVQFEVTACADTIMCLHPYRLSLSCYCSPAKGRVTNSEECVVTVSG